MLEYCTPIVNNTNADVGISRVAVGTIDNSSAAGQDKYTSYTSTQSTILERGGMYGITVERATANNPMNRKVWIDYNQDGDFDDPGELIGSESSATTLSWTDSFTVPSSANLGSTRLRVGVNYGSLPNKPCGPHQFGEFEDYRVSIRPDITRPVITLQGMDTVRMEQCRNYIYSGMEPYALAEDNVDGNLSSQIVMSGSVDTNKAGTYILRYNVQDMSGNAALEVQRVVIVSPDTTDPVVSLIGNNPDTTEVNTSYMDPGVKLPVADVQASCQ